MTGSAQWLKTDVFSAHKAAEAVFISELYAVIISVQRGRKGQLKIPVIKGCDTDLWYEQHNCSSRCFNDLIVFPLRFFSYLGS